MKKILAILSSLIAVVFAACAVTVLVLYNTNDSGNNGGNTLQAGDNSSSINNSSGSNLSGGNNTGGNTSSGNNNSNNNSQGTHTCSFVLSSTVPADCFNQGYDLYSCTCGKTDKRNYKKALGHDYKYTIHNATCTTDWWQEWKCDRCGDYGSQTVDDSKTSHDYVWTTIKDATCTADGSKSGVCADCGDKTTEAIKAAGHSYGAYTSNKDATCVKDGTESAVCTVCSHVDTKTVVGSKLGHSYGEYKVDYAATCGTDGQESRVCETCKDVDTRTIASIGHSFENDICKSCGVYQSSLTGGLIISDRGTYCEVTGLGTASGNVVIPATYNGKPVTDIGFVFNGYSQPEVREKVTGLVIPDSVTNLLPDACFGCDNLESVTIGNGITYLDDNVFGGCPKLKTVTIGKNVTSIHFGAFWNCNSIETIIFNGTKAQWNAISKGSGWDSYFGSYTVKCTDGNITL